ncbi:MAG: geranylgeranylglyceryl/heptaprenylglyceryl phosphate synthase [Crocinitomicaceae bacterium]|nr:geranylgeranylglyceryl/heptaprenylglyceryl phosphate synthase [Crocinitomicaceae bacterium]MBK8926826.1 geranylgeranylglyceryl/heptaprenylglyceryl phosphate synthase [Crocinitomicaceae bacterium]
MTISEKINSGKKQLAVLVDPDKTSNESQLAELLVRINALKPDYIFVGGSTVNIGSFNSCIQYIKEHTQIPVVIFPGSYNQVHPKADALLFLTLISGRNPDYLIGHHVEAAPVLKSMQTEIIPTGYLLIDGGKNSSVQYVSQTTPIPPDQYSIAANTALAGEMLGVKAIFLDAGSGALNPVSPDMISTVKKQIQVPLIIGGGIKTSDQVEMAFHAGADIIVIGNKIEEDPDFLLDLMHVKTLYK